MNIPDRDLIDLATLQGHVTIIRERAEACRFLLCRMGARFPTRTFPEDHMLAVAEELASLATDIREMVANSERCRRDIADAERAVTILFQEAAE